jgi:hypothetical protein
MTNLMIWHWQHTVNWSFKILENKNRLPIMKRIAAIFLYIVLSIVQLPIFAASTAANECLNLQSDSWSSQERWVWEKICQKEQANFNLRLGTNDQVNAWEVNEWGDDRVLSSLFLYDILLREPYVSAISNMPILIGGAWFPEPINLDGATINNSIGIAQSRFDEELSISASKAKYRIAFNQSWFKNSLNISNSSLNDLLLIGAKFDGGIRLVAVTVSSVIHLGQAELSGYVNMGASEARTLALEFRGLPVIWKDSAQLSLRSASFEQLVDLEESWEGLSGKVDMQGFTYNGFGNSATTDANASAASAAERPVASLLGWIEMQESRDEVFISQPYEQLASVLNNLGQDSKADGILYAKNEYRRTHSTTPMSEKTWLTIKKYVIGYGYQIWLTILWFLAVIGAGALLLLTSGQGKKLNFSRCLLYSLDQSLPLIYLNPAHEEVAKNHSMALQYYFQTHQVLSLILLSFLGAGLAGAIG